MARRPDAGGRKTYRYVKEVPLVAEDIMSEPVITVSENETVVNAAKIMIEDNFTALPVTVGEEIVGIISRSDVIKVSK